MTFSNMQDLHYFVDIRRILGRSLSYAWFVLIHSLQRMEIIEIMMEMKKKIKCQGRKSFKSTRWKRNTLVVLNSMNQVNIHKWINVFLALVNNENWWLKLRVSFSVHCTAIDYQFYLNRAIHTMSLIALVEMHI